MDFLGTSLPTPFVRQEQLDDIKAALDLEDCSAVIVRYDTGLGASSILRQLARETRQTRAVLAIHGTPSLGAVSYGALAPVLGTPNGEDLGIRTNALRAVLAALDQGTGEKTHAPLMIVDDAHAVDPATAELLVTLVLSGTVKLAASHRRDRMLPEPLPYLWSTGNAESIELFPLTRGEGEAYCHDMLAAPVSLPTSWHFWARSGGNPLLLRMLLIEALDDGCLHQEGGIWFHREGRRQAGPGLRDAVGRLIRGLSAPARAALDIVALCEPVPLPVVEKITGKNALHELIHRQLMAQPGDGGQLLRLSNPIYGEVVRQMVSPAQRRMLHGLLLEKVDLEAMNDEAKVRLVSWEVGAGLPVSTDRVLDAALGACKLEQPHAALEMLAGIAEQDASIWTRAIQARAHYLMRDHDAATRLLDEEFSEDESLGDLLLGALMRATTKIAMGMSADSLEDDIEKFVFAGGRLAERMGAEAQPALAGIGRMEKLLQLFVHSRRGDYGAMAPLATAILVENPVDSGQEQQLKAAFALALDAERLCALGQGVLSQERAAQALALKQSKHSEVFLLPETIVSRQLATALCVGDLQLASALLDRLLVDAGNVRLSFGGWPGVARGMALVRQGQPEAALGVLLPSLESLRVDDPQQLLGFCLALAAYAAAQAGQLDLAGRLVAEHREKPAMFLAIAHERAYLEGAREYVTRDGAGLAALERMADGFKAGRLPLLELQALAIAVEVGAAQLLDRLEQLAAASEGPWAQAVLQFCRERESQGCGPAAGGPFPEQAGAAPRLEAVAWFMRPVYNSALPPRQPQMPPQRQMLPPAEPSSEAGGSRQDVAPVRLTRREGEIAALAVQGLSDRAIAAKLSLSTRTVEGHLYRVYAKLGVAGRENLTAQSLG